MKIKLTLTGPTTDLTVANVKLAAALAHANGRASAHTARLADIIAAALDAEQQLAAVGLPKSRRVSCRASYESGGSVPSSYKYPRLVTRALIERGSGGWYVTNLTTATVWPSVIGGTTISIPASADEYLVGKLHDRYAVIRPTL